MSVKPNELCVYWAKHCHVSSLDILPSGDSDANNVGA